MALHSDCNGCRNGHHEFHKPVVRPGIPGLIGSGHYCHCTGDCAERNRASLESERRMYLAMVEAVERGRREDHIVRGEN